MKVLLVCTGNTCRSPIAEALLTAEFERQGGADITVGSAGAAAWDGAPATADAIQVMREVDGDLSSHRARYLTRSLVASSDLILGMTQEHLDYLRELGAGAKSFTFSEYAAGSNPAVDIADPIGQGIEAYRVTRDTLAALSVKVAARILAARGASDGAER